MSFTYHEPETLGEAVDLLRKGGDDIAALAGGTDLLLRIRRHIRTYASVVNLKRIPGLDSIEEDDAGLTIGALTTFREIECNAGLQQRFPALVDAARVVAGVQIRNLATIGGNLANASPSADSVPAMIALNGSVTIVGPGGERSIPIEEAIASPGKPALEPGEIFTQIRMPRPAANSSSSYERFTPRSAMDIGIASVGAALTLLPDGQVSEVRIALGAVSARPLRASAAEALFAGERLSDELLEQAGILAAAAAQPITDIRGGEEYRRAIVKVLTGRTLTIAAERAGALVPTP